jgi:uncharacterized glyoxalase superfamily protein PhnB
MNIPKGHQVLMPYLIIRNADRFPGFAQHVFNANQTFVKLRDDGKSIMHSEIQIANSTVMFCDTSEKWQEAPANLFVYVNDATACYNAALNYGATSVMDPARQNYGYAGGIKDPFGNVWWITSIK